MAAVHVRRRGQVVTSLATTTSADPEPAGQQPVALVDLLDRLLGTGVVLSGDITISIAGVDLVDIRLHALITSVRAEMRGGRHGE